MSVVVVGANHRTAPLDLLERMTVSAERLPKLLHGLDEGEHTSEVIVLSTCNRTEVYLVAERFHGAYQEVRDFFADLTFLPPERFADSLYVHYDEPAVRHLFEVAAGVDSAVPGEHEILGQVRTAWEVARNEGTARRGLNLLFRHALEVGKRARTETRIAHHVTSVSQAAVIMAGQRLGALSDAPGASHGLDIANGPDISNKADLTGRRAVLVGAGSMGRGMASFLAQAAVSELVVANRTVSTAVSVVADVRASTPDLQARAVSLEDLRAELAAADLLLTATDATQPIVTVDQLPSGLAERSIPLLVVDVAVPRDVEAAVADVDGVELLDMDAVAAFIDAGMASRRREVAAVRSIISAEVDRFSAIVNARTVDPLVTALHLHGEDVRSVELERFAKRLDALDPDEREAVEALTKGLVAKLLHGPTVRLKDAAGTSQGDRLAESLRDLFDLS